MDGLDISAPYCDRKISDLHFFDGNYKPDVVNRITLDCHRVTRIKPEEVPEHIQNIVEVVTIKYFIEKNVPLPAEKPGKIIRKCTEENFIFTKTENTWKSEINR